MSMLLTRRRPIDHCRVATCLCRRPALPATTVSRTPQLLDLDSGHSFRPY